MRVDTTFEDVAAGRIRRDGIGLRAPPELWTSAVAVLRMSG
jgi:hypothetical protein